MKHRSKKVIYKTWDEFWGPLLMIRFHRDNPARWEVREKKANWIFTELNLLSGARLLNIGCGDGLLDICLARLGAKVTAVDRISSVLKQAATEPDAELVEFIDADIRKISFAKQAFDLVLIFDMLGLLSREDEIRILKKIIEWLKDNGRLMIDCPKEPEKTKTEMEQELEGGTLQIQSTYNPQTRYLHIRPKFHEKSGNIIELSDAYAKQTEQRLGIMRYIYTKDELTKLLTDSGFEIQSYFGESKMAFTFIARIMRD